MYSWYKLLINFLLACLFFFCLQVSHLQNSRLCSFSPNRTDVYYEYNRWNSAVDFVVFVCPYTLAWIVPHNNMVICLRRIIGRTNAVGLLIRRMYTVYYIILYSIFLIWFFLFLLLLLLLYFFFLLNTY